ncbi:hypothetical protein B0B52_17010 [Polaromonas sp. A23]|nr:hypothetical protein B0B52_17010 [Polaromonas sp. A23]
MLTACLVVAGIATAGWWLAHKASFLASERDTELRSLQIQLQTLERTSVKKQSGDFTQSLPPASRSDEVVRELSHQAQLLGVQITSLSVVIPEPSISELRKFQFNLNTNADYKALKLWLGELLARYPSLAVQALSMRGASNDSTRQEALVSFVLFVKD